MTRRLLEQCDNTERTLGTLFPAVLPGMAETLECMYIMSEIFGTLKKCTTKCETGQQKCNFNKLKYINKVEKIIHIGKCKESMYCKVFLLSL
jgi:hypothetical protein